MGEYRSTRGEKPPETTGEKRRRVARNVFRVIVVLAAFVAAGAFIKMPRRVPASGYATTAPYAEVRAPLTGVIVSISAFSGDKVKAGDVLVHLSDEIEKAAVQRAEIEADRVRAELAFREAEYLDQLRSHSNEVQVAALALEFAQKRLEITRQLVEEGVSTRRDLMSDEYQVAQCELRHRQLSGKDLTVWRRQVEMLRRQLPPSLVIQHEQIDSGGMGFVVRIQQHNLPAFLAVPFQRIIDLLASRIHGVGQYARTASGCYRVYESGIGVIPFIEEKAIMEVILLRRLGNPYRQLRHQRLANPLKKHTNLRRPSPRQQ